MWSPCFTGAVQQWTADYAEWTSIPAALLARGYRAEDVVKVMGGNFVRVLKPVAPA
jgi:microsomal dipeptidase-like Zn-dependent dipeptidase